MRNGGSPPMHTTILAFLAIAAVAVAIALALLVPRNAEKRRPRSMKFLQHMAGELQAISARQRLLARKDASRESRRAAWLMAKADYAVYRFNSRKKGEKVPAVADRLLVEDTLEMLLLACHQNQAGCAELTEEKGSRLRAYRSP
ncbi:MAG: hypothetical protein IJJ33_04040, partial [Victivallales bacterium]|nr:hypothetical protein [Victivallales bacterium]